MKVLRHVDNPIITPGLDPSLGTNINGPSVIRVPEWVPNPMGKYYLYFAHHQGQFIRMAYADSPLGPYRIFRPGVLAIADTPFQRHIASPDVHVDEARRIIWMHYHGSGCVDPNPLPFTQVTCYAESADGRSFRSERTYLWESYLRTFCRNGWFYGLSGGRGRQFCRSSSPQEVFQGGPVLAIPGESHVDEHCSGRGGKECGMQHRMRHAAFHIEGDRLWIYYSNVMDCPERIKRTAIDLSKPWDDWRPSGFEDVIRPGIAYEGVTEPLHPSRSGARHYPVQELRDPYVLEEYGHLYLFYSVAGEQGIAVAEITENWRESPVAT